MREVMYVCVKSTYRMLYLLGFGALISFAK